ncbi:MAG: hypothetical protein WB441_07830 [Nocardioidaceae bacterium]
MEILAWLAPSGLVLVVMMAWAAWAGRPREADAERSEEAYERFAQAIGRPHPGAGLARPTPVRDRSTGVAVRRSRSTPAAAPEQRPRRSA